MDIDLKVNKKNYELSTIYKGNKYKQKFMRLPYIEAKEVFQKWVIEESKKCANGL